MPLENANPLLDTDNSHKNEENSVSIDSDRISSQRATDRENLAEEESKDPDNCVPDILRTLVSERVIDHDGDGKDDELIRTIDQEVDTNCDGITDQTHRTTNYITLKNDGEE